MRPPLSISSKRSSAPHRRRTELTLNHAGPADSVRGSCLAPSVSSAHTRAADDSSLYNPIMEQFEPDQLAQPVARDADGLETIETPVDLDSDGLLRMRIDIRRALPNRRLDKYLSGRLGKDYSRTALQGYIREGMVTVNGRKVKPSYVIRTADVIDMLLPEIKPQEIPPEPIPLDVVYEDEDILAVNKQANLIIHPARGNWTGTLVNALAYYFQSNWRDISDLPTSGAVFRPGIVHRLDKDTTGIILIAKTQLALWRLGKQFELRQTRKIYNAIVHGTVERDEDIIAAPIGRHPTRREMRAVYRGPKPYPLSVKDATTQYKVLERIGPVGAGNATFTLMELKLLTGRTHQLRVHMSLIGHPMVGDRLYGGGPIYRSQLAGRPEQATGAIIGRQALHARSIEFRHPRSGKKIALDAPWPEDFVETLGQLQKLSRKV